MVSCLLEQKWPVTETVSKPAVTQWVIGYQWSLHKNMSQSLLSVYWFHWRAFKGSTSFEAISVKAFQVAAPQERTLRWELDYIQRCCTNWLQLLCWTTMAQYGRAVRGTVWSRALALNVSKCLWATYWTSYSKMSVLMTDNGALYFWMPASTKGATVVIKGRL